MSESPWTRRDTAVLVALTTALGAQTFWYGWAGDVMFPDEGFYLTAAKRVTQGKLLYRDFAYFQGPLLPYCYAPLEGLGALTTWGGRLLSSSLAVGCWALLLGLGWRLGGTGAMTLTGLWLLFTPTIPHILSLTVAYGSLSHGFLLGALLAAAGAGERPGRWAAAGGLLGLAAGVRLPFAPLVLGALALAWLQSGQRWRAPLVCGGAFLVVSAAVWGPFLWTDWDRTVWNTWTAQALRSEEMPLWWNKPPGYYWWNKLRIARQVVLSHLGELLALGFFGARVLRRRRAEGAGFAPVEAFLLALAAFLAFLHLAPKPTWTLYFVTPAMLLLPVIGAWMNEARLAGGRAFPALVALFLAGHVLAQGGWLKDCSRPRHLKALEEIAETIGRHSAPRDTILTFMPLLALDAGRDTPPGYEMSFFGYYPRWPEDRCRHYRIVNTEMEIVQVERAEPDLLALTNFHFLPENVADLGQIPRLRRAVNSQYEEVARGRGWKKVEFMIYRRRSEPMEIFPSAAHAAGERSAPRSLEREGGKGDGRGATSGD